MTPLKKHMNRVAEQGCVLCRYLGREDTPAELHHLREEVGMGQRENNWLVIPLCSLCHRGSRGFHGLGRRRFEQTYGVTELDLLAMTIQGLNS